MLSRAWGRPSTNIVSLVAWGGVGKTALVMHWLAGMQQDDFRGASRVYGWSFYSQGTRENAQASSDAFMVHALDWFGDPKTAGSAKSPWDKGERLAELVCQERTLLILDGLEPLQRPPGAEGGMLRDPAVTCLLKQLAVRNPGLCVITTRVAVGDLQGYAEASVRERELKELPPDAGVKLLRELGCTGTKGELAATCEEFGCHALALTLLGRYLSAVHKGDVAKRDLVPQLTVEPDQGGHARRVMESYEHWLEGTPELAVLRIMGLFDRPADAGAIEALLAEPAVEGLTEPLVDIAPAKWAFALKHLRELRLLAPEDPEAPGALDCHPLVREHFAARLQEDAAEAWQEAHGRLYEHYRDSAEEFPDTLEEMAPLFMAVAHGCAAGRHQEALDDVYEARIQRGDQFFSTKMLGAIGSGLAALSAFFEDPWRRVVATLNPPDAICVLGDTGFDLRALGRLAEALGPMAAGLDMGVALEDWLNAAIQADNLSELCLTMGGIEDAVAYAERGVDLADRSGDAKQRILRRTNVAYALHQAGRVAEAAERFREAEGMQKERQRKYPLLYSVPGYCYCDLLLALGEHEEVLRRMSQILEWREPSDSLLDLALEALATGRGYVCRALAGEGDFGPATKHLDEAVDGLRQAGQLDQLPRGLLARAELFRHTGEFPRARYDLDEVMTVATRSGMRLYEADGHLEYGRLLLAEGKEGTEDEAREHLDTAREMIEEMGYGRRRPECHLAFARLLLAEGEPAQAREELDAGRSLVDEMGYASLQRDVDDLEGKLTELGA